MNDKVRALAAAAAFITVFFMALYETSFDEATAEDLFLARDRIISEYCNGGAELRETEKKLKEIETGRALRCDLEHLENLENPGYCGEAENQQSRENQQIQETCESRQSRKTARCLATYVKNSRRELDYLEYRASELKAATFVKKDGIILVKEKEYRVVLKDNCGMTKISQIM